MNEGRGGGALRWGLVFLSLSAPLRAADTPDDRSRRVDTALAAGPRQDEAGTVDQTAMERGLALYRQDRGSSEAQQLLAQASMRFPERRDLQLALLDSYLLRGDLHASAALLHRLGPELDSDSRFAFDAVYYLLQYRQADLARETWRRAHRSIQARMGSDPALVEQRELGEDLFVEGLLAAASRQKEEALRLLRLADERDYPPLESRQMLILADTFYELGEDGLAVPTYLEFLQHWPEERQARLHLALSLEARNEWDGAREQLERVLREDPRFPGANYQLGSLLFDQKHNDEATVRLERELELDPRCYPCLAKLAHLAYLAGDDQSCESWLRRAEALNPAWDETNLVRGMLEIRAGRYDAAIQHLSRVVEQTPEHLQAHYQLQVAYRRAGNVEKALEHARTFEKLTEEQRARTVGRAPGVD